MDGRGKESLALEGSDLQSIYTASSVTCGGCGVVHIVEYMNKTRASYQIDWQVPPSIYSRHL